MHDLNDALDELRNVIPYAHSPSVRKLSKIATLLLAKNYILMQGNALEELRRLVAYLSQVAGVPLPNPGLLQVRCHYQSQSPWFGQCRRIINNVPPFINRFPVLLKKTQEEYYQCND